MRLFIALELPPLASFGSAPRAPERHLTLRFLGETAPERVTALREAMERAVAELSEFQLAIGGGGTFPSADRPRVVWAGVTEGQAPLVDLERRLSSELERAGVPSTGRPFVPHVTVLRVRGARDAPKVPRLLGELENAELGRLTVREIVLFESRLSPAGAEHHALARACLRATVPSAASASSK